MNVTEKPTVDTGMEEDMRIQIVINSVLLYVGVFANLVLLVYLLKTWKTSNRVYFFVLCLCIADIIGVGVRLGVDIGWLTTVRWTASDAACKITMFLHMFGIILAHYFLASFNIDNVITVCSHKSYKIARILLILVSLIAAVCICAPEVFAYNVYSAGPEYAQCVRSGYFKGWYSEIVYLLVEQAGIYWFPLLIIILSGIPAAITWCRRHGTSKYEMAQNESEDELKTLGTELVLVTVYDIVFVFCWTPVAVMELSYLTHYGHLLHAGAALRFFYMHRTAEYISVTNSCFNPIIYGVFACLQRRKRVDSTSGL